MVIMKGMETQTDCKKCPFMATDGTNEDELNHPMMCIALWITKHETKHCVSGTILDDCPLIEIVTCKDCKYWDKENGYCKPSFHTIGRVDYILYTSADFFCENGKRRK